MISSFLRLLEIENKGKLSPKSQEYMAFATNGARRMTELVDDLLEYSKIGASNKERERVDLNEIVNKTLINLKIAIEESSAHITFDLLPQVTGNSIQLAQLFQNLLANAIKYHQKDLKPEIHTSVQKRGGDWLFCMKDNGIGFEMCYADVIFDQFRRLHGKSEYPGSGLGLATCKRIVQQHGGRIWAESEPGKGSSFYFTIPQDLAEETDRV